MNSYYNSLTLFRPGGQWPKINEHITLIKTSALLSGDVSGANRCYVVAHRLAPPPLFPVAQNVT